MTLIQKRLVIIALLTVSVGEFYPATPVSAALSMEITSLKPAYLPAEPVFIDITLKNSGTSGTESVSPDASVEIQLISVFISAGQDTFRRYDPGFVGEPSRQPRQLEPAQQLTLRQLILFDHPTRDYAFPRTGSYRIKAVYHRLGVRQDVESNTIEVRIEEATGPAVEALRLFKNKSVAELIMNLGEDSKAVTDLEALMARYPDTVYGTYAQYYLARRQAQEFFTRKPNYDRAASLYRELIQRDPKFSLVLEAKYGLGMALVKTRQYGDARISLDAAQKSRITDVSEGARRALESISKEAPGQQKERRP